MTFFTPPDNPLGLARGNAGVPPIVQNLPQAQRALARKLQRDLPTIREAFPDLADNYVRYELDRANKGLYPLTSEQTLAVLRTAQTKQAQTLAPKRDPLNVFGNIAKDATTIVQSIPKLLDPRTYVEEIKGLDKTADAISSGNLAKILKSPGIRMIPGAYTARNLIKGDLEEAVSHPLMTALDVAPGLKAAGAGAKLGRVPTPLGTVSEVAGRARAALGRTVPGQVAQEAFSPLARRMMAGEFGQVAKVSLRSNPELAATYTDDLSRLAQASTKTQAALRKAFPDPTREAAVFDILERDINLLPDMKLTDIERSAVETALNTVDDFTSFHRERGNLQPRTIAGKTEDLTPAMARRFDTIMGTRDTWRAVNSMRNALTDPTSASLADIHATASSVLSNQTLNTTSRRQIATGLVHAMDAAGLDTAKLFASARTISKPKTEAFLAEVKAALDANPQALRTGALSPARVKSAETWLTDTRKYTDAGLAKREQMVSRLESRVIPARWTPTVERAYNSRLGLEIEARLRSDGVPGHDPRAVEALEAVQARDYDRLIERKLVNAEELGTWRREAVQAWQDARAQGAEPVYLHHASRPPSRGPARITTVVPKPSQLRERVWDNATYEKSLAASIDGQRLELLREDGARAFVEWMEQPENGFVETRAQLTERLRPTARRIAQHRNVPFNKALEDLINKEVAPWDGVKNQFVTGTAAKFKMSDYTKQEALFVRKPLASALDRLQRPSALERGLNPVIGVFRTAILPFSVRWQTNNILGGLIMAGLEDPRVLMHAPKAFRAANEMRKMNSLLARGLDASLPADIAALIDSMPAEMRAQLGSLEYSLAPESLAKFNAGRTLGRVANQYSKAKNGIEWAANKSFSVNQMGDDMYRIMAYLEGSKKGDLDAGVALVNKIMPRWGEMTPFERSIIRPLVPFYPFLSHVFRYAYRFPADHPWRTAVLSSFARAEIEDLGTGLPQIMASLIPFGGEDADGNQTFLDLGAANPFRGLGDDLTFAGFLSETNPVFRTALEGIGFNPINKGPDLYPEVEFDPRTGQLTAKPRSTPGLLSSFVTNLVPQAGLIQSLAGANGEFREMLRNNPEAAQRMMLSQLGVPLYWRSYNPNEMMFEGERRRQEQQKAVLSRAMKTGDYSAISRYPELKAAVDQLQVLQKKGALDQFNPAKANDENGLPRGNTMAPGASVVVNP